MGPPANKTFRDGPSFRSCFQLGTQKLQICGPLPFLLRVSNDGNCRKLGNCLVKKIICEVLIESFSKSINAVLANRFFMHSLWIWIFCRKLSRMLHLEVFEPIEGRRKEAGRPRWFVVFSMLERLWQCKQYYVLDVEDIKKMEMAVSRDKSLNLHSATMAFYSVDTLKLCIFLAVSDLFRRQTWF